MKPAKNSQIERFEVTTKGGNTLSFFYNPDNSLVVVGLVHANGGGGNELLRKTLNEKKMLKHIKAPAPEPDRKPAPTREQMKFLGESMIVVGEKEVLGYLMEFSGMGVFDATYGKVDVTPDEAIIHNHAYDKANLEGLDNCKVGESGIFYARFSPLKQVTTFLGKPVSSDCEIGDDEKGRYMVFRRGGKEFKGYKESEEIEQPSSVLFERIK